MHGQPDPLGGRSRAPGNGIYVRPGVLGRCPATLAGLGSRLPGDLRPWPCRPLWPMLSFMTTEGHNAKLDAQVGKVQAVPGLVG